MPNDEVLEENTPELPDIPEYITGEFVLEYIANCSDEVQQRFEDMCALRGIEFEDDDSVLRTAQLELFMECI